MSERNNDISRGEVAALVTILGLAGYGGIRGGIDVSNWVASNTNRQDSANQAPVRLQDFDRLRLVSGISEQNLTPDLIFTKLAERYQLAKKTFRSMVEYELDQVAIPNKDTRDFYEKGRVNLAIDGAVLLRYLHGDEGVEIDEGKKSVVFNGVKFDLSNRYQLFLVDRIIDRTIVASNPDAGTTNKTSAAKEQNDLTWLASQSFPVDFRPNYFLYPRDEDLSYLAVFYRKIADLGYPLPSQVVYKGQADNDPAIAWYEPLAKRIVMTTRANSGSIIHEELHHQSHENQRFLQSAFNLTVDLVQQKVKSADQVKETYVNSSVLEHNDPERVRVEDYAETLRIYFVDGIGFRSRLKTLRVEDPAAYEVMRAKYAFAREFYKDQEYLTDGEVFEPKVGDAFKIDDPDRKTPGVLLRKRPTFEVSEVLPSVFRGDTVRILEGPVPIVDPAEESKTFWYVQKGYFAGTRSGSVQFIPEGDSGWMSQEWFGDKAREDF